MRKSYYTKLRDKYKPKILKIVFIFESPPESGKYFYNDVSGKKSETLFKAMMKLINFPIMKNTNKKEGLMEFKKRGYFLIDATYEAVNDGRSNSKRNKTIKQDFYNLIEDFKKYEINQKTKIIVVKANVCKLLISHLKYLKFNVLNASDYTIPFPSNGWQKVFTKKIKALL